MTDKKVLIMRMDFEYGSKDNPVGNCLVYCAVANDSLYFPNAEWIASNIYVSFLPINGKLPVVAFPPIAIKDPDELVTIARGRQMDIIRIEDFIPPDDEQAAKEYFQYRVNHFNDIVMEYVNLCRFTIVGGVAVSKNFTEIKGKEDDLTKLDDLEQRFLKAIEKRKEDANQASYEGILGPYHSDSILQDNRYDFSNLWALFHDHEGDLANVVQLFFEKFRAVYREDYELASKLQMSIHRRVAMG